MSQMQAHAHDKGKDGHDQAAKMNPEGRVIKIELGMTKGSQVKTKMKYDHHIDGAAT